MPRCAVGGWLPGSKELHSVPVSKPPLVLGTAKRSTALPGAGASALGSFVFVSGGRAFPPSAVFPLSFGAGALRRSGLFARDTRVSRVVM